MLPVLLRVPSKPLFVLLLILAVVLGGWNVLKRRNNPKVTRAFLPLYPLLGAWFLLRSVGGSWVPHVALWSQHWEPFQVYSYGTMLSVAIVGGWLLIQRFAKTEGLSSEKALAVYVWSAVWALIGARVLYFLTEFRSFPSPLDALSLNMGGMVAYGGMIGGFFASWYCCRKRQIPLFQWADVAIPSVALGTAITRVGCFLNGCDYGRRTDLPWGVCFPSASLPWIDQVAYQELPEVASHSLPVHPTQLYESLASLIMFGFLMHLRRRRLVPGFLFLTWVVAYGLIRSLIEVVRGDSDRGSVGPFSTSQIIGLLSAGLAMWGILVLRKRHRALRIP
jgi:phosphatidylglycerol:prolipoprotein diacylglycerol transferase